MTPVVTVEHLHKRYGSAVAVDDVSFSVEQGEIFGIVGPNGAGKTTTVECIEGLRVPDRGLIRVLGLDPRRDAAELHQRVGVQLQDSQLPERLRVAEALELYSSFYGHPADWRQLLAMLGLAGKNATAFRHLSGGEQQRLSIALALVGSPEFAVLDELTTGLDPQARREAWSLIEEVRDQGVTILLVTHFMEEAQRLCDRGRGDRLRPGRRAGHAGRAGLRLGHAAADQVPPVQPARRPAADRAARGDQR
jgi:ABC-2 type transport system ATP-binding protein